ncbi:MAG: hypothetical protein ACXQS8_05670 [Candidatus Helarchaeales archaeon]
MVEISNRAKTMTCVATAGLLFIPAVIFDLWYLVLIGAVFDWLPLPTGWMKINEDQLKNKNAIILHVITTLVAYALVIAWIIATMSTLVLPSSLIITLLPILKFTFLEIWWLAVIIGTFITK